MVCEVGLSDIFRQLLPGTNIFGLAVVVDCCGSMDRCSKSRKSAMSSCAFFRRTTGDWLRLRQRRRRISSCCRLCDSFSWFDRRALPRRELDETEASVDGLCCSLDRSSKELFATAAVGIRSAASKSRTSCTSSDAFFLRRNGDLLLRGVVGALRTQALPSMDSCDVSGVVILCTAVVAVATLAPRDTEAFEMGVMVTRDSSNRRTSVSRSVAVFRRRKGESDRRRAFILLWVGSSCGRLLLVRPDHRYAAAAAAAAAATRNCAMPIHRYYQRRDFGAVADRSQDRSAVGRCRFHYSILLKCHSAPRTLRLTNLSVHGTFLSQWWEFPRTN
jgi:hypothetical protein